MKPYPEEVRKYADGKVTVVASDLKTQVERAVMIKWIRVRVIEEGACMH